MLPYLAIAPLLLNTPLPLALPPQEEVPEEVLRTEVITEARSPVDGRPLSAADYAELQTQLREAPPPELPPNVRQLIFLLSIRKAIYSFFPFLPR